MPSPDPIVPVLRSLSGGRTTTTYVRKSNAEKVPGFIRITRTKAALATAAELNALYSSRSLSPTVKANLATSDTNAAGPPPTAGASARPGAGAPRGGTNKNGKGQKGSGVRKGRGDAKKAPVVKKPADIGRTVRVLPGATYFTLFKAFGTVRAVDLSLAPEYDASLHLAKHPTEDAPATFYSNEYEFVKYEGVVPEQDLVSRLNSRLQAGDGREDFDFRNVYTTWEYRYSVVEFIGEVSRVLVDRVRRVG